MEVGMQSKSCGEEDITKILTLSYLCGLEINLLQINLNKKSYKINLVA